MSSPRHAVGISIFASFAALLACHCIVVQDPVKAPAPPVTQAPQTTTTAPPPATTTAPPATTTPGPKVRRPSRPVPKGGWFHGRRVGNVIPSRPPTGWIDCPGGRCGTPGKVACDRAECAAGAEACCVPADASGPRCVPVNQLANQGTCCPAPGAPAGSCQSGSVPMSCDDTTDCPSGLLCCVRFGEDGSVSSACSAGPCDGGEVCSDKGGCSAGNRCAANPGAPGGVCRRSGQTMPCGTQQCAGDRPYCSWNKTTKAGTCAGPDPRGRSIDGHFECLNADQCAQGESCCVLDDGTQAYSTCMTSCPVGAGTIGCRNITDCPKEFGAAMGTSPKSCDASTSAAVPATMKTCRYAP